MAMTAHERVSMATEQMSEAIYAALDAIDSYVDTVTHVASEQETSDEPNHGLIKRMGQFETPARAMSTIIEDDVLTHLNFCTDRLFSVKSAEEGEFI
ncbi:MAG: hypothetical protein OEQ47_19050 [Acidimicrobiia bacterium]|nr:hypothetical protein [Acidimicrobiia bacterium]